MSGVACRVLDGRAHWRPLANTVKWLRAAAISVPTIGGGDAACSQVTLAILLYYVQNWTASVGSVSSRSFERRQEMFSSKGTECRCAYLFFF